MGGVGGGKGASGGSSGTSDYPAYMKNWHGVMLSDVYNLIQGSATPPTSFLFDPKIWFGMPSNEGLYTIIRAFGAVNVEALLKEVISPDYVNNLIFNEDTIADIKAKAEVLRALLTSTPEVATDELVDAYSAKLLQKVESDVIPKIEIGMRDANAVIGSSFVIAKALALDTYTLEVSEFTAKVKVRFWELRYDLYKSLETLWMEGSVKLVDIGMKRVAAKMEHMKLHEGMISEAANLSVVAQTKFGMLKTENETKNATWKLDLYDHMNKTLASISEASPIRQSSGTGSSIMGGIAAGAGGALAGAAAGAALGAVKGMPFGGPVGAGIGAAIGLFGGLFGR